MGEVYKARDTRLDRTVAVKVLPEHIAQREDVRARFEREARAVASLNHPNVCSLFDIGPGYMVMELIEGETLATRIDKGALPLDQALQFATQIADALDRAHRAGVTHRDIKPQNIMLTRDGVKVLDFGLAKSVAKPGPTEATLTNVLTTEGTVMGTPRYMAPEQFEGKEADARSDIWAFGAVLYEMVTGQKAFQGKSYSSLLGAILSADPAPMAVKPFTPAWLERLVRRCLQKEPENRYHCMRDLVMDLKSPPAEVAPAAAKPNRWLSAVAGVSTLAFLVAGVLLYNAPRPAPLRPLMRLNVEIPAATPLARVDVASGYAGFGGNLLALSPDGARLVLSLRGADGKTRLHTRLLHQSQLTPLAGTENAHRPFFSPGGDWIGFFADGKMKKIAVEGGAAVTLCDAPMGYGGSWGDDGNIIAALDSRTVLSRIPSAGGTPVPMTKLNAGEVTHRWPQVLPGEPGGPVYRGHPSRRRLRRREHRGDLTPDRRTEDTVSRRLLPPLSRRGSRLNRERAPRLPAPVHAVRRALRRRPPGSRWHSGADSGGRRQHPGIGRGFHVRGEWNAYLPRREGSPGCVSDFLGRERWQDGTAAARPAGPILHSAFLARRQAVGVFDGDGQRIRHLGEGPGPGHNVAAEFPSGLE